MKNLLVVVDVQNDFLPGGNLAVPGGDEIIPGINRVIKKMDFVVATQDWHPHNHLSFAANHGDAEVMTIKDVYGIDQIMWPTHCVQNTEGAEFAHGLEAERFNAIIRKGMDSRYDSYSGLKDSNGKHTGLHGLLTFFNPDQVYFCGLSTDFCVKATVMDTVEYIPGEYFLIEDLCRGVNVSPEDSHKAIHEMHEAGVKRINGEEIY